MAWLMQLRGIQSGHKLREAELKKETAPAAVTVVRLRPIHIPNDLESAMEIA